MHAHAGPAVTERACAAHIPGMKAVKEQEEAPCRLWEISIDRQGCSFRKTSLGAAELIVDTSTRRFLRGHHAPLLVNRLDVNDVVEWDASSDVADVLRSTGWPQDQSAGRDTVVELIRAILVD